MMLSHGIRHSARTLSPRATWCYAGEDLMKIVRPLVGSCSPGNSVLQSTEKAMFKYLLALDNAFSDPEHWLRHHI
jgi:hypothetical protein